MNSSRLLAVLVGGFVAGALDIAFAISFAAYNGVAPIRLLQTVASGLVGNAAFAGGVPMAALGLALHFGMSILWAGVFLALVWLEAIARCAHPFMSGIAFGSSVFSSCGLWFCRSPPSLTRLRSSRLPQLLISYPTRYCSVFQSRGQ
jgi:hypothetical protein